MEMTVRTSLLLVGKASEPCDPLHAVGIEAKQVRGGRTQGDVLCGRGAVDERHVG